MDFSKIKETRSGNFVAPGAFVEEDGVQVLVRGGDGHQGGGEKPFQSFGAATPQAIDNGPADHGVVLAP